MTELEHNVANQPLSTLGDYLRWAERLFRHAELTFGHGTNNAWDEAVMLAMHVLNLPADVEDTIVKQTLTEKNQIELRKLTLRRINERLPVPYLTGEAWFAGEKYVVNEHVLIPRSPIAELIDHQFQPWLGEKSPKRILDLCTGSGCIAIHCAKTFPNAKVDAIDISTQALAVAKENVKRHNCESQVNLIESDLFSKVRDKKYDIIVSNPPYVGNDEMNGLPPEFQHEPKLALASGFDGLDITKTILAEAEQRLTSDGLLVIEVGNSWEVLEESYPEVSFTWLEFERGGEGVFLLTAEYLAECRTSLNP